MHHLTKESSLNHKEELSDEKKNDTSFKAQLSKEAGFAKKKHFWRKEERHVCM